MPTWKPRFSSSRIWSAARRPPVLANWRFQQALYRAYYDAYTRARLVYETGLEERALSELRNPAAGSLDAMKRAEDVLELAVTQPRGRRPPRANLRAGGSVVPEHSHAVERAAL